MKVLVTGHRGYIGVVLVPLLLKEGHEVCGLDSDLFSRCTFGEDPLEIPQTRKDVREATHKDVEGFDAIIHLAGLSNDPLGNLNPDLTFEINHRASVDLARLAKESGVPRFVFSSSCSNYGAGGQDWITESSAFNPVTPYGESKVLVEQDVSAMADDQFSPTFLRNATAYGVSSRLRFDLVLNNLVAWAFATGRIFLKSDGSAWRPIVHIEDISRAFLAVIEAPRETIHCKAFNVGRNGDNYRIKELAEIVGDVVPDCRIEYASDAGPDKRCYRVDCSLIEETLPAFKPEWDARRGARELYEAYRRYGVTVDEFEGVSYKRIAHIEWLMSEGLIDERLRVLDSGAGAVTPAG